MLRLTEEKVQGEESAEKKKNSDYYFSASYTHEV